MRKEELWKRLKGFRDEEEGIMEEAERKRLKGFKEEELERI